MSFLLVVYVVGHCFPAERGIKCPTCMHYIKNGISASVVVWFLVYLVEKQAVKVKKSSEVLA